MNPIKRTYLPVASLLPWSPFDHTVWCMDKNEPVTKQEVQAAIEAKTLLATPPHLLKTDSRADHIARIAWLVLNVVSEPIDIDVGVPSLGCTPSWLIQDGHHRLAAAIFRGDEAIEVEVSGDVAYAASLFGVTKESLSLY